MRLACVVLLVVSLLVVAGCGDDGEQPTTPRQEAGSAARTTTAAPDERQTDAAASSTSRSGTRIVAGESQFGRMLFDARKQAIYIFERDSDRQSACYGECAQAWPPVYSTGEPVAGSGVRSSLLGTIERRDGRMQATYAGKPLYYYAHEERGEVRCHNVGLNGGLWWVVGPDGKRRP
jgi:predicted lipoprotein with Yx(FWY)xxD motif